METPGKKNTPFQVKLDQDWFKEADKFDKPVITYKSKWDKWLAKLTFGWFGRIERIEYKTKQ